MNIRVGFLPLVFVLVLTRVFVIMAAVPFFGSRDSSPKIKVAMAFSVSLIMLYMVPEEWVAAAQKINSLPELVLAVMSEVFLGGAVGLICHSFVGACMLGGMAIARDSSLMMAQSIDPLGGSQANIVSSIFQAMFTLIVLLHNGHLMLLKFVGMSFRTVPHSLIWVQDDFFKMVFAIGQVMFDWALRIAVPVIAISLILNVCMGLLARLAQGFNILMMSMPIRLGFGLGVFGFMLRFGNSLFEKMTANMLEFCGRLLAT